MSSMTTTTAKLGTFIFGLLIAITGGLAISVADGVGIGDYVAGAFVLVGVVCMIKSIGMTTGEPSKRSQATR